MPLGYDMIVKTGWKSIGSYLAGKTFHLGKGILLLRNPKSIKTLVALDRKELRALLVYALDRRILTPKDVTIALAEKKWIEKEKA